MRAKTRTSRLFPVRPLLALFVAGLVLCTIGLNLYRPGQKVEAATNGTINFQARLMNAAGSIAPDGDYNIEFKLYSVLNIDGGETPLQGSCTTNPGAVADEDCLWTETLTGANKVHVANGYLTVNLGKFTTFPTTINWDQDLWLTMRVGGTGTPSWDTEMSPRLKLTAVPYAFRAGQLAKLAGGNTAVLEFASSFGQPTVITLPDPGVSGAGTVCYQNSTACGFLTGTASNYIQNGTSVQNAANFNIRSTAIGSVGGVIQGANGQTADLLQLQTYNGTTSSNVFAVSASGAVTLNGGQSIDVTTATAGTANGLVLQPGVSSALIATGAAISVRGGDASGTTTVTAGLVTIQGGNATGASGTRNGGGVTIDGGTGATANGAINVGTANSTTINIGSVGTTAKATTISIGTTNTTTAGAVQGITIGSNSNLAHTTVIQGGSGNGAGSEAIRLVPQTTGGIAIGSTTGTGTITLGQSTASNTINIGNGIPGNGVTQTISIGNGAMTTAGATAINVNILSGTAGTAGTGRLNLANNDRVTQVDVGAVVADAARTLNLFTGAAAFVDTINIGTGATAVAGGKTINIGNGTLGASGTNLISMGSLTNASTTTIQGGTGTGAVSVQSGTGGTISIGTSGVANTVQIGNTSGATAQTVNIGNNTTTNSTNTIAIGGTGTTVSTAVTITGGSSASNNITLQTNNSGSGVLVKSTVNSTGAFQIQNSAGATGVLFNVDTVNGWVINNSVEHPGNLLENPSFEAAGASMLSGWSHNAQSVITVDNTNAHHGNNVMVSTPNSTLFTITGAKYLEAVPGDQFYADIWYKSSGTTNGSANFAFTYYDKDKASIGTSTATTFTAANTTYTRAVANGTAPANTAYVRLVISVAATSTTGTWYFDELTVSKTTESSPKLFKNAVNSATAFQVQNANADNFLGIDTSGNAISVGYASSTTTLNGTVKVTTLGAYTSNSAAVCRDTSTNTLTSCDSGNTSGIAFLQGGNSFGTTGTLGTNDANNLQFETNNVVRATFDTSNGLYLGNGVTNATPANFTVNATGSATAGTAGANLTLKGGAGASTTTGSAGGDAVIQGGAAGGSGNNAGGNVLIQGGAPANSGAAGQVIVRNAADSTGAFQVQNAAGNSTILNVNTTNGRVGIGGAATASKLEVLNGDAAIYNSGNNPRLIVGDSTTAGQYGYLQWDSTNDYFRVETAGTNGLKISDNFVSIGNIAPTQPLIVGNGTTNLFQISTGGVATLIGGQTADITTAAAGTATALTLQPGLSNGATTTGAALNLRGGDASGTTNVTAGAISILAGNATGGSGTRNGGSVTIDAGTGASANGGVTIGGTNAASVALGRTAGTTTLNGTVKVTTLGAYTSNSAAVCRDTSTTNLTACDSTNTSGIAFLQGGNSFGTAGLLGTNDNNSLQVRTNGIARATFDTSNGLYLGLGVTNAAPTAFTVAGTGSATAGVAGAALTIQGGAGATATTGSVGGDLKLIGGAAGGSGNNAGGQVLLQGGSRTGTGAAGTVLVKNAADSATAFSVQNAAGTSTVLDVDTTNGRVGIGTNAPSRNLHLTVNNSAFDTPATLIQQTGTGDSTIEIRNPSQSYFLGVDTSDGSKFKISSMTAAATTSAYFGSDGTPHDTPFTKTDSSNDGWVLAHKATVGGSGGTVTSISVYIAGVTIAPLNHGAVAIYSHDSGTDDAPQTLLATSATQILTPNSWNVFTIPSTAVTAGTSYWLAMSFDGANTIQRYEDTGGRTVYYDVGTIGTWPTTEGDLDGFDAPTNTRVYSIYATMLADGVYDSFGSTALFSLSDSGQAAFKNRFNSTSAFQVQNASGDSLFGIDSSASTLNIGAVGSLAVASTTNIGTSTGATQTINVGGTGGTAANGTTVLIQGGNGSSAVSVQSLAGGTISIGTAAAGTVVLGNASGTVRLNVLGASTTTAVAVCRDSANGNFVGCASGTATGTPFIQGGNSFAGAGTLGTNDANNLQFETNNVVRATFDTSNALYVGNGVTAGAPANFAIRGTGSSTAGATPGATLTIQGGAGASVTTGSAGGVLQLQGGNAGGTGNNNGGNVALSGGTATGTGARGLVVIDTPTFTTAATQNCGSNCTVTQANVDSTGAVVINATAASLTVSLPDPTIMTAGRIVYVTAANASNDFTLSVNGGGTGNQIAMRQNTTATMVWNGNDWTAAGASSSTTLQAAYDNTLSSAGGAEIVLNNTATSDGLTIRNNASTPIIGAIFETQTAIGSNLFSVNNNATEYASNGGAETAGASSSTFPANTWSAAPGGGTVTRNTTSANNATGQASVSVVTTAASHGAANRLSTTLTANLEYTVSFTIRGSASFTTLDVLYSRDGTNTSPTSCVSAETVTTAVWSRIICNFTAPSSGITSSNSIFIRQSDATGRTFYVDNLSVTVKASSNHAVDGSVDLALGTNWTAFDADGGAGTTSLSRDTTTIYDTSGAVADVTTAAANLGMRNNLTITPQINTQYLVTFYARSSNTFNDITAGFLPTGGSSVPAAAQRCTDYNTQTVSTTGWTKITCIVTTGATAITDADLVIYQPSATARTFYVDALSMTLNTNTASNVQVGGGADGGPPTLFTLDRSAGAPIANNNDAYLGSMYYDTTTGRIQCYEADGWGACGAAPDNVVNLNPEYAGAVLNGSGVGTMSADFCSNDTALTVNSTLCAVGQAKNFYTWTSPQATMQTYSIYVTYQLPATFNGFASDDTVQLVARSSSTTNAAVTYEMYKSTGSAVTQCGTGETTVVTTANTWQSVGINGNEATGCSFSSSSAGNFIIFKINVKAQSNANAYVSTLSFTTTGK